MQWLDLRCRDWIFIFLERERERAPSLYIFGHSDHRFSTEQEVKLFYAARATCGHDLVEFRQLQEVGIFFYL